VLGLTESKSQSSSEDFSSLALFTLPATTLHTSIALLSLSDSTCAMSWARPLVAIVAIFPSPSTLTHYIQNSQLAIRHNHFT
jgi:hypothetical protein